MGDRRRRIQRRRTKGWRMPKGAVYVGRPSLWGNPFQPEAAWEAGYRGSRHHMRGWCTILYRDWLAGKDDVLAWGIELQRQEILRRLPQLRGHDLACWCPLDQTCHADVLLELANR